MSGREQIASSLTGELSHYVDEAKYFREVRTLPGDIGRDDVVLRFSFDEFRLTREVHPAYFPCALLTATLYIWFNGPIYKDVVDLSGQLTIEDGAGARVASATSKLESSHNVGLFDTDYALPNGLQSRTEIVKDLLDKIHEQLRTRGSR